MEDFTLFDYLFSIEADSVDYKNPSQVLKSLVREKKTKYRESSFLDLLKGEGEWEDVYRVTKRLLLECKVDKETGVIDMAPVTRFIDEDILSQVTFRMPTKHEAAVSSYTTKSEKSVTVVVDEKAKVGVLDKKLRGTWDCSSRGRAFHWASGDWVYQVDLIRFFSELIVLSEINRYYRDKLEGRSVAELKEDVVYGKHIPKRVSVKEENIELIEFYKELGIEVDISKQRKLQPRLKQKQQKKQWQQKLRQKQRQKLKKL